MDAIIHTSKIRWGYPSDRQQPKAFRIQVGRTSGNYYYNQTIGSTPAIPGGFREYAIEHILDYGNTITGIYYIKISSIHYDDTEVAGNEFIINVVVPTDEVVAPIVSVY